MPLTQEQQDKYVGQVVHSMYGDVLLVPCSHPASDALTWDLPLNVRCKPHRRTIYYCNDLNILWCDGGPPDYRDHLFRLVPFGQLPPDALDSTGI